MLSLFNDFFTVYTLLLCLFYIPPQFTIFPFSAQKSIFPKQGPYRHCLFWYDSALVASWEGLLAYQYFQHWSIKHQPVTYIYYKHVHCQMSVIFQVTSLAVKNVRNLCEKISFNVHLHRQISVKTVKCPFYRHLGLNVRFITQKCNFTDKWPWSTCLKISPRVMSINQVREVLTNIGQSISKCWPVFAHDSQSIPVKSSTNNHFSEHQKTTA